MALSDDIRALQAQAIGELNAALDFLADLRFSHNLAEEAMAAGRTFNFYHPATGTLVDPIHLRRRSEDYVNRDLPVASFTRLLAAFEAFFFDLLALWLAAHPDSLNARKVDFRVIREAADKDALTRYVVGKEINEVMYERPTDWFVYLESRMKLGCPSPPEIARLAEAKATRDIFAHNRGRANDIYRAKSGPLARYPGSEVVELPDDYHRGVWELLRKMTADIGNAAAAKT